MRKAHGFLLLIFSAAILSSATANPVFDAVTKLGQTGLVAKPAPATSPTAFKPASSRPVLDQLINETAENEDERKVLRDLIAEIEKNYQDLAKAQKLENDGAAALAFLLSLLYELGGGEGLDEQKGWADLTGKLRATLDTPEVRAATNAQKQELYDLSIGTSCIAIFVISTLAEDPKAVEKVKGFASTTIKSITGLEMSQISVKGGLMTIKGKPGSSPTTTTAPPAARGLAPQFSYTTPSDWKQESGWLIREIVDRDNITRALVRFPDAIPAGGNMGEALETLWDEVLPAEGKGKMGGFVFRRYVGDRLLAQFVCGVFRENGRNADTAFMLMLIDCKTHWQPVVIALTYDSDFTVGIELSAQFSYPKAMAEAEKLLSSFRCAPAAGGPLATREALVGDYGFGNGSAQNWVNIYTGATSMTFLSYGGTLNLKADGKFTYTYSSASGAVGATTFRGAKGAGTWQVAGDQLICTYTSYDQGDGHKVREHRYRIAGVNITADGTKILVLLTDLVRPVNVTFTGESSDWYSTKKK